MVDQLILVRHGKSQTQDDEQDDIDRKLTEAGERALIAKLPIAMSMLEKSDDVVVWSSPACRTMDTAEIVALILDAEAIEIHESLYAQDVDEFMAELAESTEPVVVVVGHNPSMEHIAFSLDGSVISFDKGAVAAFRRCGESGEPNPAAMNFKLEWFVQGPDVEPWKTLVTMEKVLTNAARHVKARRRDFLAEPTDPESLHRFRVAIRLMRSLVTFVEPYQKHGQNLMLANNLRELERLTSQLRDYDILCEEVESFEGLEAEEHLSDTTDDEASRKSPLAKRCKKLRAKERSMVLKTLQGKDARRLLKQVIRASNDIHWKGDVERNGVAAACLRMRLEDMRKKFIEEASKLDPQDVEASHALRKDAKRIRYISSEFAELLGEGSDDLSSHMAQIQDELGELFDARVNRAIISKIDTRGLPLDAMQELGSLDVLQTERIDKTLQRVALQDW